MAQSLTYVELDVPFCTRTYGEAPCQGRVSSENDPTAASFDGATYLKRGAGMTGAADSKQFTISCWIRPDVLTGVVFNATSAVNGATQLTSAGVAVAGGGPFFLIGYNAAGTQILDVRSSALSASHLVHVLISVDLTSALKRHLYIDDVSDLAAASIYTNDTIDFTMADWGIGGTPGGTQKFTGDIAQLWIAPGVYLDLSVDANRRKFIDADGNPVDLGAAGATPTGSSPLIFLNGDISTWATNDGTGGGFTTVGTLTEGVFSTGDLKCFNSTRTCQDRDNLLTSDVTLRFAKPTEYLPREIDCIPSVASVDFSPAVISLGKDLGQRASLTVTFQDHRSSDTGEGYDKYRTERDYDPYLQGSYFGKFRARQPFLRGKELRWITGKVGDDLADMETRYFIVDSFSGPTPDGKFTITAKDVLKLADGDRAQAPLPSNGFLASDITAIATTASLLPSGIGNDEYPASGYVCIGGNEVCAFTRSSDTLTLTRGQLGSTASTHKAQDRVQLVLRYASEDVADILYDLFTTYTDIDASMITLADWQAETAAFLGNVYTTTICEPTPVKTLAVELIEQSALAIWDDNVDQQIRLQVLRAVTTSTATFSAENILAGSMQIREQPDKRLSQVLVYFGQIDPTKPLSNLDNFRSTSLTRDEDAEADYGSAAFRTIMSRWIPQAGRSVADRLGAVLLGRYRDPPRSVGWQLQRYADTDVELGIGYRVAHPVIQDETGAASEIPVQATRLNPGPAVFAVEAEEMLWTAPDADTGTRYVIFDASRNNINLRTEHDSIYPAAASGDVVNAIVNAGVVIGSASEALIAFDVGSWPAGVTLNVVVNGRIQGCGGRGGNGVASAGSGIAGTAGGPALYTRAAINVDLSSGGQVWGGGGGGGSGGPRADVYGSGGGGGGAGTLGGAAGAGGAGTGSTGGSGVNGSATAGGAGGSATGGAASGGAGGGPGLAGSAGGTSVIAQAGGAGGAAGRAIDGVSYVTMTLGAGDIRGSQVN